MNIFQKIFYLVLSLQEWFLRKTLKDTIGAKSISKKKKFYNNGCLLSLNTLDESQRNRMEEEILLILKTYDYTPKEILKYIEKSGTSVFYIQNSKYLHLIGECEGFIYPQIGGKALFLSLLLMKKLKVKTEEMFIVSDFGNKINKYHFLYHFYNWYAFKHDISGLDAKSVELLDKYLYNASDEEINKLQLSEIYKLQEAIKQDKASIDFVIQLCRKYETSKKALQKMKDNGANI